MVMLSMPAFASIPIAIKTFVIGVEKKTVTNCPKCDKPIPGELHYPNVVGLPFRGTTPDFCESCGEPFPWKGKKEAKRLKAEAEKPIETLRKFCSKFYSIARKLRNRHNSRETLDVTDEYDVQDLLDALLALDFDDVRPEEWTPSYAGKSAVNYTLSSPFCEQTNDCFDFFDYSC